MAMLTLDQSTAPWSGTGFRFSEIKFASTHALLSGQGSALHGGRWNPKGIKAVYLSLSPQTALSEVYGNAKVFGIPIEKLTPRLLVSVDVRLQKTLDLRDAKIRQKLGVSRQALAACNWKQDQFEGRMGITQCLGRIAVEAGLEGVLVPSAAEPKAGNLVLFIENMHPESRLGAICPEDLPPWKHSA